jgi:uncharacterized protein (DUF2164 family)
MENTIVILLAITSLSILSIWIYRKDDDVEEEGRTFQGMDVEEFIKKEVGEDYYNKHYKKQNKTKCQNKEEKQSIVN